MKSLAALIVLELLILAAILTHRPSSPTEGRPMPTVPFLPDGGASRLPTRR